MTTPTPPKGQTGGQAATAPTSAASGPQSALEFADQLVSYGGELKRELRSYGDANTVGRDVQQVTAFLDNINRCALQIAGAMHINWSPNSS